MSIRTADIDGEYKKNKDLKPEDVQAVKEWVNKQPHLPTMSELQIILFLQSCYFSIEQAKSTIDTYYTLKAHCPEFFADRDPASVTVKEFVNVGLFHPLPKPTKENYKVMYCRIMDPDPSKYILSDKIKSFDMSTTLMLMQEGTQEGFVIIVDMSHTTFGHFLRMGVMTIKKLMYYLQEALPVRLKGIHVVKVVPIVDKILALIKPFMKKELLNMLHIHADSMDSLYKFVPKECLPNECGGTAGSISEFHELMKIRYTENAEFFIAEEKQVADESKRPGKPKNAGDIFGVEGTFKKMEID